MGSPYIKTLVIGLVMMTIHIHGVPITILQSAVQKGAVCLDGAPPAYYHDKGFGDGSNDWLIFIEGGAWCASDNFCPKYSKNHTTLGRPATVDLINILSNSPTINPDFYNWNRVYVVYCDGSSFMGDVATVKPGVHIYRRGARIFDAIMDDLLAKGMNNARNAILSGSSAGGLTTILHCDAFSTLIPNANKTKCISDSGFFISGHTTAIPGVEKRVDRFATLINEHGIKPKLFPSCTTKLNYTQCMFPENLVNDIKTPLFIIESSFDTYQLLTGIEHGPEYKEDTWTACTNELKSCTPVAIQYMKEYSKEILKTIEGVGRLPSRGVIVNSCLTHVHLMRDGGWQATPTLGGNATFAKLIGDWYFDRSPVYMVDTTDVEPRLCNFN